jgi:tRNA A37 methylthiotransferase MiaB
LISLGCAKNLVDAEIMLGSLLKERRRNHQRRRAGRRRHRQHLLVH